MRIIHKYVKSKEPLTLREALDACVVNNSERGKAYIYKRYYGYLMAITLRYVKHEMEAEEITNESFVKVFRKLEAFSQHEEDAVLEKTFKSWMARIAVNTSIDVLRVRKNNTMLEDVSEQVLLQHATVDSSKMEVQDILNLLHQLPDLQKSIFNLYEIEGYSHDEIGEMLSIPESTSRTYLTRAKQKLRKLYTEQFITHNLNF
ncbi:RNA polymerase sigma factor [Sphingobacterium hungaricum]|uniref:RNA polymerase sigma factor n=1 Tax=Sphingobacterium hungaricum TaxID=2082723 RepID=A0A928UXK1_9SPHI|nr:RNA polymerase sigma factor [Sphingobacterium hungaricum]MBE8714863.1 RNA polymerase sigma factor [Sphingobacterium hungaricum]